MKYTTEIEISSPVERVIELFDNPDNLKHWQPELQSFEQLSGSHGQPGAKSKIKFKMGKREVEMIETVTVRNLPDEFSGTYETKGIFNIVRNRFIPISDAKTRYVTEQEFHFKGFMVLLGLYMPGAFKKQSMKYLEQFKVFNEKERKAN